MKNQQVNVDYWSMLKAMFLYGALTALGWLMLRLFNTVFMLPGRLRSQQDNVQSSLKELQRRFPDLNITEEDLINADKELEKLINEEDDKKTKDSDIPKIEEPPAEEDKKTL
ncbi:unnamed protein product, partial [Iphiclides podalirius]